MSLSIIDATTQAAVSAATTQVAQLQALESAWEGGNVNAWVYDSGDVLLQRRVQGPWTINGTPALIPGALISSEHVATGTPAYTVYRTADTAIFRRSGGTWAGTAKALCAIYDRDVAFTGSSGLPASALPSWLGDVGEWSEISGSALNTSGVGWSGTSPGGAGTYLQIVSAWGGGILNTTGIWRSGSFVPGIFLVIFGGGHGDYGGNELYAFGPLGSDSPTWSRITDPTIPAPDDIARDGSGNPVSRHSYDTLVYLPTLNKMLCIGAPGFFHTGSAFNAGDLFDFSVNPAEGQPWASVDTGFPAYGGGGVGTINLISGYDSVNGRAWGLGKGNAQRIGYYSVGFGTWTSYAIDNPGMSANSKAGLASSLQLLVSTDASGAPIAVDLRSTPARFTPSVTGTGPGVGALSLEWDEAEGRFVCWGLSGKTVYYLTPGADPYSGGDDWAWSSVTPSGGATPASPVANGTYGRLRLVQGGGWRGIVLMPSATANLQVFRMA